MGCSPCPERQSDRDMAATAGAILVGVVVYVILVLALRTLTREDLEMMPGGKKAG